ncbi:MAG: protein kinase [Deltaproteobacteria bacterium]|nr:protein kinase [Deltaproteobacteria bacterium]
MARTCSQCGASYDDEVGFCPEDGTRLPAPHDASEDAAEQAPVEFGRAADDEEATVDEDDDLLGRSIGSYRVLKLLGKGGMGGVYLAEHPVIGSKVAIKFLHPRFAGDKKIVDRFFNEARAVNVIGHDNILKILDLNVTEDGRHYFIMELLQGKSLQTLVEDGKPAPLSVTGPILLQFCEALQAAHDRRIYHRDIKPDNVYLVVHKGRKNFVKVVDFGVAKLSDSGGPGSTGKTQTGMVIGTPAYMSPEQAGGVTNRIDARSDVYSAGVMMFQLATGKLPFPGTTFGEVLIGHLQMAPPDPRELNPEISEQYSAVILKALEKKQDERYQSMRELAAAIHECMDAQGIVNELPTADGEERTSGGKSSHVTPGFSGTPQPQKKPTGPPRFGAAEVAAKPKAPPKRSGNTLATRMEKPETAVQRPPARQQWQPPPKRSNVGVWIGAASAGLAILVLVAVLVLRFSSSDEDERERRALVARETRAAFAQMERAKEAEKNDPELQPQLSVLSDPPEARVEVTWPEGERNDVTPFALKVPRNTRLRLTFTLKGYITVVRDVIADESQVVKGELQKDSRFSRAKTPRVPRERANAPKTQVSGDEVIDVGDDIFDKK